MALSLAPIRTVGARFADGSKRTSLWEVCDLVSLIVAMTLRVFRLFRLWEVCDLVSLIVAMTLRVFRPPLLSMEDL